MYIAYMYVLYISYYINPWHEGHQRQLRERAEEGRGLRAEGRPSALGAQHPGRYYL